MDTYLATCFVSGAITIRMARSRDIPQALQVFRKHGGALRTQQAVAPGVHPATLYELRDNGRLTQLSLSIDISVLGNRVRARPLTQRVSVQCLTGQNMPLAEIRVSAMRCLGRVGCEHPTASYVDLRG